jgi:hypothetical protein
MIAGENDSIGSTAGHLSYSAKPTIFQSTPSISYRKSTKLRLRKKRLVQFLKARGIVRSNVKHCTLFLIIFIRLKTIMATASVSLPPGQPDITYTPDFDKYKARTQKRLATEKLERELPPGFPSELKSDLVWDGHNIAEKYNWLYQLSEKENEEIEQALAHFKCLHYTQPSGN